MLIEQTIQNVTEGMNICLSERVNGECPCCHKPAFSYNGKITCLLCGTQQISYVSAIENSEKRGGEKSVIDVLFEIANEYPEIGDKFKTELIKIKTYRNKLLKINNEATEFYMSELLKKEAAINYLKCRKIEHLQKGYRIGYSSYDSISEHFKDKYTEQELFDAGLLGQNSNGEYYSYFRNRVLFPLTDSMNRVVGFSGRIFKKDQNGPKYLNTRATCIFSKKEILYNYANIPAAVNKIYVCEGPLDVLSMTSAGLNAVCTMGTALSEFQISLLKQKTGNIILMYDGDEAGQNAINKALKKDFTMNALTLPEGIDPDDYFKLYTPYEFGLYEKEHLVSGGDWLSKHNKTIFDF